MKVVDTKHKAGISAQLTEQVNEFLNCPFPYYFEDTRKNTLLCLGFGVFLMLFMAAIDACVDFKIFVSGFSTFAVLFLHIVVGPKLFPKIIDIPGWTIGRYVLFTSLQVAVCAIVIPIALHASGLHQELPLAQKILIIIPKVVGYGITPLIITTLLLHNHMLRESLVNAQRANQELATIQKLKQSPGETKHNTVTIIGETKETLEVKPADLLFVEANDNYSTFYWTTDKGVEKKILRLNLKNAELQLDNHLIIRCHRSFIVNLSAIVHFTGNANGYKLTMKDSTIPVPVSRAKGKEVITRLEHLRSMIEVN